MNTYYEKIKALLLEMAGSLLVAIGLANFAAAFEFPMTGFSGIALIVYRLFHIPLGFTNLALNIPIAIICYRLLGKQFFFRSLRCMVISSLMMAGAYLVFYRFCQNIVRNAGKNAAGKISVSAGYA